MAATEVLIVDYGVGNLRSVFQACTYVGATPRVSSDPNEVKKAGAILLPGVGAFPTAMRHLEATGLGDSIVARANAGVLVLGVCLGMQLLFEESSEMGLSKGLSLIPGKVGRITQTIPLATPGWPRVKETHIGWKPLSIVHSGSSSRLFEGRSDTDAFYFLHTYSASPAVKEHVVATARHGEHSVVAIAAKQNVFGIQFHPEKSGVAGLRMLQNILP